MVQPPNEYYNYAKNQFSGIEDLGEPSYGRAKIDNPPFLWPANNYTDIAGRDHTVERGYMRSLITDPTYAGNTTAKNRRLFFQFNPQVLVRSVQQSVGAMNPLLQDPAQLSQPVPGTASFGFELFFNREHEVNSGYNTPGMDWFTLPVYNRPAEVSQIGVLADLMVLDTITGQGISQDLINTVLDRTKQEQDLLTKAYQEERLKAEQSKNFDPYEFDKTYKPKDQTDQANTIFQNNIGNTAFLNPLPFRVIFSSLYMVEGLATSVDVVFQKFSRTMVPTQCKVTINMYALYIGFARKDTFLQKNLRDAADEQFKQKQQDYATKELLDYSYKEARMKWFEVDNQKLHEQDLKAVRCKWDFKRYEDFVKKMDDKQIKEVTALINFRYYLTNGEITGEPTEAQFKERPEIPVLYKGETAEIPMGKLVNGLEDLYMPDLRSVLGTERGKGDDNRLDYIHFQFTMQIQAKDGSANATDNIVVSTLRHTTIATNFKWYLSLAGIGDVNRYRSDLVIEGLPREK